MRKGATARVEWRDGLGPGLVVDHAARQLLDFHHVTSVLITMQAGFKSGDSSLQKLLVFQDWPIVADGG